MFGFFTKGAKDCGDKFREQEQFRIEGAMAAHDGLVRDDCPYNKEEDGGTAWNFWVYGNDVEWNEWFRREHPENTRWSTTGDHSPTPEEISDYQRIRDHFLKWMAAKKRRATE